MRIVNTHSNYYLPNEFEILDGGLTMRALDAGDSAAIPSSFLRLSLFPVGRGNLVRPSASNANRQAE